MTGSGLVARLAEEGDQGTLVRSPAVGILARLPEQGDWVDATHAVTLRIVGRDHPIRLPARASGWVTELLVEPFAPVEYDQPLFRLNRAATPDARTAPVETTAGVSPDEEGLLPVRAPSHGVFYRRPDPDSPPYVNEGATVTAGTVLGLVEIMKSFHEIAYGGPDLPEVGVVVRVLVEDTVEVESGQPLLLIRASD